MKTSLLRLGGTLFLFMASAVQPAFFLVGGTLLFGVLFFSLLEGVLLAFAFEFLTGTPSGLVVVPLTIALLFQQFASSRIHTISFISRVLLFFTSVGVFFFAHGIGMTLYAGSISFLSPALLFAL